MAPSPRGVDGMTRAYMRLCILHLLKLKKCKFSRIAKHMICRNSKSMGPFEDLAYGIIGLAFSLTVATDPGFRKGAGSRYV